ncbi:MAG: hypothetical protein ALECFALPRED_000152 [Alectoria fallacina]|uniref:Uncharacterized protein n=1 Tax=Alectoria fallacina TaxID=1903189 RepID=A0A8H3EEG7_9LECA|nr:MAG: hypothetical protein ALECFALPRED_000152 [Alectoria fallacina]
MARSNDAVEGGRRHHTHGVCPYTSTPTTPSEMIVPAVQGVTGPARERAQARQRTPACVWSLRPLALRSGNYSAVPVTLSEADWNDEARSAGVFARPRRRAPKISSRRRKNMAEKALVGLLREATKRT